HAGVYGGQGYLPVRSGGDRRGKGGDPACRYCHRGDPDPFTFALIVIFVVLPLGGKHIARSLLGSTAVVAAVVGFAAQEAVKNMFAGLQLSIYKPFDVGSRVEFEDGTTGVIESMNLRHVVVSLLDTTKAIIPNSSANSMRVISYSYGEVPRSAIFKFPVSYDCDVDKAKEIIRQTICGCPLTLNEDKYDERVPNSRCVYFLSLEDSALIMGATVRFPSHYKSEVVKDEINTSLFKALKAAGIEIPYNKMDVSITNKA
ncbi:MAG: mechanosensitive ion channel family protein, partial [Lachnospiraceae bacterium]|nr:mechanosensitive ion channel family protein [Lachnospiraceae bacterium]